MRLDPEILRQQLPYYLTAEDREVMVRDFESISQGGNANYFLTPARDDFRNQMLQGDGWRGFQRFDFAKEKVRSVRGIVMSNSCDIDPENRRVVPAHVIFAPLTKLVAYEKLLRQNGKDGSNVSDQIKAIRDQKTTNMFFLPAGGPLEEDYVVRLDDLHSMALTAHILSKDREKLFTLSNVGFYMFVYKLSIHFCRLQEKVNRRDAAVT